MNHKLKLLQDSLAFSTSGIHKSLILQNQKSVVKRSLYIQVECLNPFPFHSLFYLGPVYPIYIQLVSHRVKHISKLTLQECLSWLSPLASLSAAALSCSSPSSSFSGLNARVSRRRLMGAYADEEDTSSCRQVVLHKSHEGKNPTKKGSKATINWQG